MQFLKEAYTNINPILRENYTSDFFHNQEQTKEPVKIPEFRCDCSSKNDYIIILLILLIIIILMK